MKNFRKLCEISSYTTQTRRIWMEPTVKQVENELFHRYFRDYGI